MGILDKVAEIAVVAVKLAEASACGDASAIIDTRA